METALAIIFTPTNALVLIKILIIIALVVYTIFSFILTRQMQIKRATVETPFGSYLSTLAYIHLGISILLILIALVIL